jgi:hypothetical protein
MILWIWLGRASKDIFLRGGEVIIGMNVVVGIYQGLVYEYNSKKAGLYFPGIEAVQSR